MKAFRRTTTAPRPGNRVVATSAPSGMPMIEAMATAFRLTYSDRDTISSRSVSRCQISRAAWWRDSPRSPMFNMQGKT